MTQNGLKNLTYHLDKIGEKQTFHVNADEAGIVSGKSNWGTWTYSDSKGFNEHSDTIITSKKSIISVKNEGNEYVEFSNLKINSVETDI